MGTKYSHLMYIYIEDNILNQMFQPGQLYPLTGRPPFYIPQRKRAVFADKCFLTSFINRVHEGNKINHLIYTHSLTPSSSTHFLGKIILQREQTYLLLRQEIPATSTSTKIDNCDLLSQAGFQQSFTRLITDSVFVSS